VKRILLCLLLLVTFLAPTRAAATLYAPWWVVFTFTADPLDPLGGTSTGWHYLPDDTGSFTRPVSDEGAIDFWWQAHHWTAVNTLSETLREPPPLDSYSWWIDGGPEGNFIVGNLLDRDFDFEIKGGTDSPEFGQIYTASMVYVNPTASHNAANGTYYIATGTFYLTNQQPPAASPPGVPEPSSLALLALGVGAVIAGKRIRGVNPPSPSEI